MLGLAVSVPGTPAAETEWGLEAELTSGYDSNPLKLAGGGEDGAYTSARVDFDVEVEFEAPLTYYFAAEGDLQRFGSGLSNADSEAGELTTGLTIAPYRNGPRRLTLDFGVNFRARRKTFTSRLTGDVFTVTDTLPGGGTKTTEIAERFDYDRTNALVDVDWKLNKKLSLFLEGLYSHKNYVEDYDEVDSADPLDYDTRGVEPGVRFRTGKLRLLEVSLLSSVRDYRNRPARDIDGDSVPGTTREYQYAGVDIDVRLRPLNGWDLSFSFERVDRKDPFAGYYDYQGWKAYFSTYHWLTPKNRLRLSVTVGDRTYDEATVNNELDGEIRGKEELYLRGVYERDLSDSFMLTLESRSRSVQNEDPEFDYDRFSIGAFVRYHR